jgi:hypothetical protein
MCTFENLRRAFLLCVVLIVASAAAEQDSAASSGQAPADPHQKENAEQVASILKLSDSLDNLRRIGAQTACDSSAKLELIVIRQNILEAVVTNSLEVDGVLAELQNERAQLSELRTALSSRRDRSLNLINVANIVTGTGLGIAANALQFSDSTAKVGDSIGVVSGVGSTMLSVIGIRSQHGPLHSVGRVPNMLAPLFGRQTELNSYYPPSVREYLHKTPAGESVESGSRLDQLMNEWRQAGRIGSIGSSKTDQQIVRLTSSLDNKAKLSIDDISDRIAMLLDVTGRVGLMKWDLAGLMRSIQQENTCTEK